MKIIWPLIRFGCIVLSAVAPLAVLYYVFFGVFEAQSGGDVESGEQWAVALQVALPLAAVELGTIMVVMIWAKAMITNPASRSARVVAVAMAALCASILTSLFVSLAAWPVVLLSCIVPASLASSAFMRSTAATTPRA
ncbi:hypothetical protein PUR49_00545 [Streptomyces sp. BE147]|uniref:hypothetical protein n=1 Tax=Streptomyces sp. BE147 TaxID=3002524 RepID=UPI002E7910AE|nr:hypothetical protein [Streptomyces sp. BE147]MEE1735059.1 hypothetical protein [Streptomyces sp. BE147]